MAALIVITLHADQLTPDLADDTVNNIWQDTFEFKTDFDNVVPLATSLCERMRISPDFLSAARSVCREFVALVASCTSMRDEEERQGILSDVISQSVPSTERDDEVLRRIQAHGFSHYRIQTSKYVQDTFL